MQQKRKKTQIEIHVWKRMQKYPMVWFSHIETNECHPCAETKSNKMEIQTR